jgi:hypothetical protein
MEAELQTVNTEVMDLKRQLEESEERYNKWRSADTEWKGVEDSTYFFLEGHMILKRRQGESCTNMRRSTMLLAPLISLRSLLPKIR